MKVLTLYLAFLIFIIVVIPFTQCNKFMNILPDNDYNQIELYNHVNSKIEKLNLEDYIIGVVCAEMPAEFSSEALKAQAIAARTYAVRKIHFNSEDHQSGDLCTDHTHCQAYISKDEVKKKWGKNYSKYIEKVSNAVKSTAGEYLAYNGEPIMAVFHSCSNGITEKSSDVWGGDVPYLINVSSEGDIFKKDYITKIKFEYDEFVRILSEHFGNVDNSDIPVGNIIYSTGGNVLNISLFGVTLSGKDIRTMYSLKSTAFDLEYADNIFTFTVYGSGHGVGMSQYGANSMAENGSNYKTILNHYYPGTVIANMNKN